MYDEGYDCYLCPNDKVLSYSTTNRNGYREYKSNPKDCEKCPLIDQCTASKNHTKVVTQHVWSNYMEEVEEIRHTIGSKEIYNKRKETIERIFADCKESHCLRFTRLRGLNKNQHQVLDIFSVHNLKKMAIWSWNKHSDCLSIVHICSEILKNGIKKMIYLQKYTILSTNWSNLYL